MTKTLYVSDFDGTLLNSQGEISAKTAQVLNRFMEAGGCFSVATARNLAGWQLIKTDAVRWRTPLILGSGVMLYDMERQHILDCCQLPVDTVKAVLDVCLRHLKPPMLFQTQGDAICIFTSGATSEGERQFLRQRRDCVTLITDYPWQAGGYLFSLQDTEEKVKAIAGDLVSISGLDYTYYHDNYIDTWFLEVFREDGGKGAALERLKRLTGAERTVAFGDNLNDIPLLRAADVACAVRNAKAPVKAVADVVISSNDEDGVARYLCEQEGLSW